MPSTIEKTYKEPGVRLPGSLSFHWLENDAYFFLFGKLCRIFRVNSTALRSSFAGIRLARTHVLLVLSLLSVLEERTNPELVMGQVP